MDECQVIAWVWVEESFVLGALGGVSQREGRAEGPLLRRNQQDARQAQRFLWKDGKWQECEGAGSNVCEEFGKQS